MTGGGRGSSRGDHADPDGGDDRGRRPASGAPAGAASFEDAFEEELVQEFGDLGPAAPRRPSGRAAAEAAGAVAGAVEHVRRSQVGPRGRPRRRRTSGYPDDRRASTGCAHAAPVAGPRPG